MGNLTVELDAPEALFALSAITDAAASAGVVLARMEGAPEHERDAVLLQFQQLNRFARRLQDALYPPCDFWQGECDRMVALGKTTCDYHLRQMAPFLAAAQA